MREIVTIRVYFYYCKKTYQCTTPFKGDTRQLADLKQQI